MAQLSRRGFLLGAGSLSLGLVGLGRLVTQSAQAREDLFDPGFGPLVSDPQGLFDLPEGFSYVAFSRTGEEMTDGLLVPGAHDGMAAFPGPDGLVLLVRNHELDVRGDGPFGPKNARLDRVGRERLYDAGRGELPNLGGTTTLVYDPRKKQLVRHFLSLGGTLRNCAGGATPWGSWLTCEEAVIPAGGTFERAHGFVFEVPATAEPRLHPALALEDMGRFNHEAAAVDARTGAVYMTEDRADGLLYRFLPAQPGKLLAGGRLQALRLLERRGASTANHDGAIAIGADLACDWVDLENVLSPNDDLRKQGNALGAARFVRGEGMTAADDAIYFTCTSGGKAARGQVFKYTPLASDDLRGNAGREVGRLRLVVEPNHRATLDNCDNMTAAPWGDLILCEDGGGANLMRGVTPAGRLYDFAENALNRSELAGACFSPDGSILFVNIQHPGITLAITGPWERRAARADAPEGERRYF